MLLFVIVVVIVVVVVVVVTLSELSVTCCSVKQRGTGIVSHMSDFKGNTNKAILMIASFSSH